MEPRSQADAAARLSGPVLLYDGACGLCATSVHFVLRHDRARRLRFASLQGAFGRQARHRHPELAGVDSVVWLAPASAAAPERALVRSDAALEMARYLGGVWRIALLAQAVPRFARDWGYSTIARHRHRLAAGPEACVVLSEADRSRFIP